MKKMSFTFLFFLISCRLLTPLCFAGSADITTFHPAPYGAYETPRLVPQSSLSGTDCASGSFYVEESGTSPSAVTRLQFCDDDGDGVDLGSWGPIMSTWEQQTIDATTAKVFIADDTRTVNVGIGTTTTAAVFDIRTDTNEKLLYLKAAASADIYLIPENDTTQTVKLVAFGSGTFEINMADSSTDTLHYCMRLHGTTGNVGLGIINPAYKLDVLGNIKASQDIISDSTIRAASIETAHLLVSDPATLNDATISTLQTSTVFDLSGDMIIAGDVTASGFSTASDKNLKKNIHPISNPIAKTLGLRGVSFKWKKNDAPSLGFIAQEVEEILPDIVATNKNGEKSIQYGVMTALLTEAIKAQQKDINQLTTEINALTSKQ